MASFERDENTESTEAGETGFISLLSLADDDPYRATSGDPSMAKGRSRTRWGLAGAMLATVAAIGAVVVPSGGDDNQLDTTGSEAAVEAPATSAPTPLLGYNGAGPTTTGAAGTTPTTAAVSQASAADTSASSVLSGATGPSTSSPSTVAAATGATTAKPTSSTAKPTSTTAKPTSSTDAPTSSTAPPASTGGGCWNLVVQDDFNGSSVDGSKWVEYNGDGNAGHGQRSSSALSVSGGVLTITASMQNGTLVSGGLGGRHSQTYGRYEARVRTDPD
ncbi:MAG: glycoside hydrolase family 16 protein, partial [Acidimicrobiia bacterium]|nr:glycoside hydrolase family 16 protein [Acidimicrobiia bacterium]